MTPSIPRLAQFAVLAGAGVCQAFALPRVNFPAWDEVQHSLGALKFGHALTHGEFALLRDAWLATEIYPQLGRLGMALGVVVGGPVWEATRGAGIVAWLLSVWLVSRLAERLVRPDLRPAAAFATTLVACTSFLGAYYARTAFLEPWSLLTIAGLALAVVRAAERPTFARGLVVGLTASAALLTKYNFGILAFASVGAFAASSVAVRAWSELRPRAALGFLLGGAVPLLH